MRKSIIVLCAAIGAFALVALFAIAPPAPPSQAALLQAQLVAGAQSLTVSREAVVHHAPRDGFSVNAGPITLAAQGTNYDWAKLVLIAGKWPSSQANVTVFVRWMRQENGPNNWWNRNNPLNNGYGSGGGGGTGSYANLVIAAEMAAANLRRNPGFSAIVASLAASSPTAVTEHAIWASPWASGHYANGAHWHYSPVPKIKAPAGAW